MAREKTKRKSKAARPPALPGWWSRLSPQAKRGFLRVTAHVVVMIGLGIGAWFGLKAAGEYVCGLGRYQGPIDVQLRIKHRRDDVLVAVRDIPDARLPARARLLFREADPSSGKLVVEHEGRTVQVSADDVAPEWLARFAGVERQLLAQARALANQMPSSARSPDWFDAEMARRIRDAAASDPYVEKVVQVDKQLVPPGGNSPDFQRQVVLTVVLRRPIAQMWYPPPERARTPPYNYVFDRSGVVLEKRETAVADLPLVVTTRLLSEKEQARLKPGHNLDAPDIQAGLDLLARLSPRPYFGDIAKVDVDNYNRAKNPRGSELVLLTKPWQTLPPQPIWWGMRQDNPIEYNNSAEKMQILQNIWSEHHRLNIQDLYPGPYSLYHTRGLPFQPSAESGGSPSSGLSRTGGRS